MAVTKCFSPKPLDFQQETVEDDQHQVELAVTMTATVLEQLIDEKGIKKSFLAREAGLHPSQLSRLLHSERDPRLEADAAAIIAERLGVHAEEFLDGERLRFTNGFGEHQDSASSASSEQAGPAESVKDDVLGTGSSHEAPDAESALIVKQGAA